jgi:hypothetical protein
MIIVAVVDNQEPASRREPYVSTYPDLHAAVRALRKNYAPLGELDDVPDDEVVDELEEHYGLVIGVSEE